MGDKRRAMFLAVICAASVAAAGISYFVTLATRGDTNQKRGQKDKLNLVPLAVTYEYGRHSFADLAILDDGEMWAVGYDGHEPQGIRHTTDGGRTWEIKSVETKGFNLQALSFPDARNGWAVGDYGLMIHTSDGGQSWTRVKAPSRVNLNAVQFVSDEVGYAAGSSGLYRDNRKEKADFDLVILRTSDGGQSWSTSYEYHRTGDLLEIERTVWQLATFSETVAIAVINGNSLLRTGDAGLTWQTVMSTNAGGIAGVAFSIDGTAWTVGERGFYVSKDQGKTWQTFAGLEEGLSKQKWHAIGFSNSKHGIAVGDGGAMAITIDGGVTWSKAQTTTSEDLRLLTLHGAQVIVCGTQKVYQVTGVSDWEADPR